MSELSTTPYSSGTPAQTSIIHWGAVIAALLFVVALGWLLFALGAAIGISVADLTDLQAMGQGVGIGTAIWIIGSMLLAFFLGGLLAAHLSGDPDRKNGILHGVVLWSAATALTLVLGAMTLGALWRAGGSLASSAAQAVQGAGSAAAQGGQAAAGQAGDVVSALQGSPAFDALLAELKRETSQIISRRAGPQVSPQELRRAVEQLNPDVLQQMGVALVQGDTQEARNVLATNTNLSGEEVDAVVDGLSDAVQQRVQEAKQQASAAVETASNYAQALMWTEFLASALGLGLAAGGGAVGANRLRRPTASHAGAAGRSAPEHRV